MRVASGTIYNITATQATGVFVKRSVANAYRALVKKNAESLRPYTFIVHSAGLLL